MSFLRSNVFYRAEARLFDHRECKYKERLDPSAEPRALTRAGPGAAFNARSYNIAPCDLPFFLER